MTAWISDPLNRLLVILAVALLVGAVGVGAVGCWVIFRDPVDDEDEADFDADLDDYEDDDETLLDVRPADLERVYAGGPAAPSVGADAPGSRAPGLSHGDGRPVAGAARAAMMVQLAPAALAAENLPGPVAPNLPLDRVGEIHGLRLVDLGQEGDDMMLARDWFNRRVFVESLRDEFGGFEISEHGHLVHVPVWRAAA